MKNLIGYLLTGIRLKLLFTLLRRNRISYRPLYITRLLLLFQNACWSSFFAMKDKRKWNKKIRAHPVPDNPVFIIGHWRTGSTYLHQLLNMHQELTAPTLFQTSQPEGFIKARPYYGRIMKMILGKKRPFDQMNIGIDEAQEDEFALFRLTGLSPLELLVFPKAPGYFLLAEDCCFVPQGKDLAVWDNALKYFYRKISWYSGKRLILKNPFHSMRIGYLKEQFPHAKFIHIYRNPLDVVPSTKKMWTVVAGHNAMNRKGAPLSYEEVSTFFVRMQQEIAEQLQQIPPENQMEVRFEDLENDPVKELKNICTELGIGFTEHFETKITEFLRSNRGFKKNLHMLDDDVINMIRKKTHAFITKYGY